MGELSSFRELIHHSNTAKNRLNLCMQQSGLCDQPRKTNKSQRYSNVSTYNFSVQWDHNNMSISDMIVNRKYHLNWSIQGATRHRASTSMYSQTFCVRFLLPERHQWKPAVQTAAVMLRMPPSAAGRPRPLPVSGARFWGCPPSPAGGAHRPSTAGHSHYVVISRDGRN